MKAMNEAMTDYLCNATKNQSTAKTKAMPVMQSMWIR
jgi:hypothetical protein